jgi:hypothetical protein
MILLISDKAMYSNAYIIMTSVFIIMWVILFVFLRRSRPAMIWTSLLLTLAGPVAEYWLIPSYWSPLFLVHISYRSWSFGIEDILLTFAVSGISAGLCESVALRTGFAELPRVTGKALLRIFALCVLGFWLMVLLATVLSLTPIHALLLAVAIPSGLILFRRWKLMSIVISIAVIFGFFFWLHYILLLLPLFPGLIQAWWNLENTFGVMFLGVPIEEMLWAFMTVMFAGPVYRICRSNTLRNILGIKKKGISDSC